MMHDYSFYEKYIHKKPRMVFYYIQNNFYFLSINYEKLTKLTLEIDYHATLSHFGRFFPSALLCFSEV